MQINSLSALLKDFRFPVPEKRKPSLPPRATPTPEKNKVVSNPTLTPVNRQAAFFLQPIRSWLSQPLPPAKLPTLEHKEIERLKAEVRIERNEHAITRDTLGQVRLELRESKAMNEKLKTDIRRLQHQCQEKDNVIRQLEDLKL